MSAECARRCELAELMPDHVFCHIDRNEFVAVMNGERMPDKFRGKILFHPERCIGCKLCMKDCPAGAIEIRKVGEKKFECEIDLGKCIYCAQCVDSCMKKALEATKEFELASLERNKLKVIYHAEHGEVPKKPS